jgi:peptide/nickel transport system permease protein
MSHAPQALVESVPDAAVVPVGRRVRWRYVRRRLLRSPAFVTGAVVLGFWVVMALAWRHVVPHDPFAINPLETLASPSSGHWFGTDDLGRDVFARVLAGVAPVLTVAPAATAVSIVLGVAVGLVAGYYRGLVDELVMRLMDALLAFPLIIIAVLVLALLGKSTVNMILVIAVLFIPNVARTVRSSVLAEREQAYVEAARLRGENGVYVMLVEILPNITSPIVVEATIRLGYAVFTAATLAFLSLGVQAPSPDWGLTISLERAFVQVAWWTVIFPALALASLIVSVNLIADSLRRAIAE